MNWAGGPTAPLELSSQTVRSSATMSPARRHFYLENAAKCRDQASRATSEADRRAWNRMADEWENLVSGAGRWSQSDGVGFFDQEAGTSHAGIGPHEPPTK